MTVAPDSMPTRDDARVASDRPPAGTIDPRTVAWSRDPIPSPRPFPLVTLTLVFANVVLFALPFVLELVGLDELFRPGPVTSRVWAALGASRGYEANLAEPWRWITSNFLHFGGAHLALNAISLAFVGVIFEQTVGPRRMLSVAAVAGIAGTLLSSIYGTADLSAGASATIFGLVAGWLVLSIRLRRRQGLPAFTWRWVPLALFLTVLLVWGGDLFTIGDGLAVDTWGHWGGAAGGFIVAALIGLGPTRAAWRVASSILLVAYLGVGVAVPFSHAWSLRYGPPRMDSLDPLPFEIEVPSAWHRFVEPRTIRWTWAGRPMLEATRITTRDSLVATLDRLAREHRESNDSLVHYSDHWGRGAGGVTVMYQVERAEGAILVAYRWIPLEGEMLRLMAVRRPYSPEAIAEVEALLDRLRIRR